MRERLIGALVLVAIVVLLVPAILKGRGPATAEPPGQPTRRVEVPLNEAKAAPEEKILVPETPPASPPPIAEATPQRPPAAKDEPDPPSPAPHTPQVAAAAATPAWAVQLGAFSDRAKAERLVAELRKRRYSAFVLEYRATGQVLYRVRVGPEQDRARAEEIAARLAKDGFQPVVARHP